MAISSRDLRLLYQQSGNICAFPDCRRLLTMPARTSDPAVPSSEVAHIVAKSPDGPRGDYPLPLHERDHYENLILLCQEHHYLIDSQPRTFPVEKLRQFKYDHEAMVAVAVRKTSEGRAALELDRTSVVETLYSSLLAVERIPRRVYSVRCDYSDHEEHKVREHLRPARGQFCPYIVRAGRLFCFQDLRSQGGPFTEIVSGRHVEVFEARDWWNNPDKRSWYVSLLNRTLNKVTGRKGLNFDRRHKRFFFMPDLAGLPLEITYRPMNMSAATRFVVWQPITKKTAKPKKFWYHCAVSLKFHMVSSDSWCLSIRPELHITSDGSQPLQSEYVGRKITRKKSRMFNYDVLGEIQFWRDFLFSGQPRMIVPFDARQALVVSSTLLSGRISWPGVPPDRAKKFRNEFYEDDLFSLASLSQVDSDEEDYEEGEDYCDGAGENE